MANPLSQLENLAEQLVEGTFDRLLSTRLQPIQVARHLGRAMEDGQMINPQGQIVVPNEYIVLLNPADHQAMANYKSVLQTELVRYVTNLARRAGAIMMGRPRIQVQPNPAVPLRSVRVAAQVVSTHPSSLELTQTQELPDMARVARQTATPKHMLYDGYRKMTITEAIVSIGRGLDNDIILDDKRVSRRHAQLRRQYEQYVLYDLGSTGGTTVNGLQVREAVLQTGDVIGFAGIKVTFERIRSSTPPTPPRGQS